MFIRACLLLAQLQGKIKNINGQIYNITVMNTFLSEMNNDGDHTGKSVSIPNEFILTSAVANFTRGSSYVWDEVSIYLTYKRISFLTLCWSCSLRY